MIVDEGKGRISCYLIEVSSSWSNCFSTILTKVPLNHDFLLFFFVVSSFKLQALHTYILYWLVPGEPSVMTTINKHLTFFLTFLSPRGFSEQNVNINFEICRLCTPTHQFFQQFQVFKVVHVLLLVSSNVRKTRSRHLKTTFNHCTLMAESVL